jgi:hypothetical protein
MPYLRRSASSVRNTVQSSSFLRGSVFTPLSFSAAIGRGGTTWVGLSGSCGWLYKESFSVEKDLGTAGTAGAVAVALKRPLRRLFFLLRGMGEVSSEIVSLASESSGMLTVLVGVFCLLASLVTCWLFLVLSSFCCVSFSREGEDDDLDCCCDCTIHDLRRSLVSERAGEAEGELACLTASLRPRSALRSGRGSTEGSLLLLEKGLNLDARREVLGLNVGI